MAEERIVPGEINDGNREEHAKHAARYDFARAFVKDGCTALDMACGTGYGTAALAGVGRAKKIYGVDRSKDAISYAKEHFKDGRVEFLLKDISGIDFPDGYFDLEILFETIEHLDREKGAIYLEKAFRALKGGGTAILSCPNRDTYPQGYEKNPYHIYEYSFDEIRGILSRYYRNIDIYCQEIRYFNRLYKKTAQLLKHLPPFLTDALTKMAKAALERRRDLRRLNPIYRIVLYERHYGFGVFPFVENYNKCKPVCLAFVCRGKVSR